MKNFVQDYKQRGLIKEEKIGFDQVVKHLSRARKDLKVAEANLKIDTEAAYNYAYLAMLRTGRALMLSYNLRPTDGEQHKTIVSFCDYILGEEFLELVRHFDRMRKKRNQFTYDEPDLLVSDTETKTAFETAKKFVEKVLVFIQKNNPQQKLI
jgi:uncharacterized protein (UPF0332 family)